MGGNWRRGMLVTIGAGAIVLGPVTAHQAGARTPDSPAPGTITTVAGSTRGFSGDAAPATMAGLRSPRRAAALPGGGYLIAEEGVGHLASDSRIRRVSPTGTISTVAGTATNGFSGDGGPATQAQLNRPASVAVLPGGGFLIADTANRRIRKVDVDGIISTVAGTGEVGVSGDGGPAAQARLTRPVAVAVMPDGGYLIADEDRHRVRRVAPDGIITRVAGNGVTGHLGDGGPAVNAMLAFPTGLAVLPDGSFFIADTGNHRIRHVGANGVITRLAGMFGGFSGDGGPAAQAELNRPTDVTVLPGGELLVADSLNRRVRRIFGGIITTVAGTGVRGSSGDGGPATGAQFDNPQGVTALPNGAWLVVDAANNQRVRRVATTGVITMDAGRGVLLGDGDEGRPATQAQLDTPQGVTVLPDGGFVIADTLNHRIRRVSANGGRIITIAGGGPETTGGGFAFNASLSSPSAIVPMALGGFLLADTGHHAVRSILPDERITGANTTQLDSPRGVAVAPNGDLLIADTGRHRILKITAGGALVVVAGTGTAGSSGDGGPATNATLSAPRGLAALPDGGILVADSGNHRIRKVDANGIISTLAGSGPGFEGDGGPATAAKLNDPRGVSARPAGGFYIADTGNHRVRLVGPDGVIRPVAGTTAGLAGAGGPATAAKLDAPTAVALLPGGGILIADSGNHRIRKVA